ncbi:MAG: VWA domain-containing protein [Acidobacteria bacterium]|nr:VWA domain-containing protein [Acidobacteriota bacterium]
MRIFAVVVLVAATSFSLGQTPAAATPAADAAAQDADAGQTEAMPPGASITVRSSLVVVPALVRTKAGQLVYTLKADDFRLTDDGVEQTLHLEQNTGDQPLALVIVVQTGGDASAHLEQYQGMEPMLDNLVGNIEHKVAVVGFDGTPTLLHGFTPNLAFITHSLDILDPGDQKAAVLDAVAYAVKLLGQQPTTYRRAILLLSETTDDGSHTTVTQALHAISDTNTTIYSVGFHTTKTDVGHEAAKFGSDEPGPQHGCFSRDFGTDEDGNAVKAKESKTAQDTNCVEELLPPLRLAHMAEIAARNAMRHNISKSVAKLTGGEYFKFKNVKTLDKDLFTISNHIPNRYVLTFQPTSPTPGFHYISLKLRNYPQLNVDARDGYWVNAEGGVSGGAAQ